MNTLFEQHFLTNLAEEYVSGVFSDELDKLGRRHQVSANWQMNNPKLRMFGRVRTLEIETIETDDERIHKGLGFLGSLESNDILVVKGSNDFAYFGELMSRLAMERKLAGVVVDGLTRDTFYTQNITLPIFARGNSPVDIKGRGRVDKVDVPVKIDDVEVNPGDYIFGDSDAIVVIPENIFDTLKEKANSAVREEGKIKEMISQGKSITEILEFTKAF